MRQLSHSIAVLAVCAFITLLSGCVYDGISTQLAYAVCERVAGKILDIPFWTEVFREKKGRFPRDYAELQQFVSRQTGSRVQLEPYVRVDFAMLPSGQRQAECYFVADGVTNKSVMTWGKPKQ